MSRGRGCRARGRTRQPGGAERGPRVGRAPGTVVLHSRHPSPSNVAHEAVQVHVAAVRRIPHDALPLWWSRHGVSTRWRGGEGLGLENDRATPRHCAMADLIGTIRDEDEVRRRRTGPSPHLHPLTLGWGRSRFTGRAATTRRWTRRLRPSARARRARSDARTPPNRLNRPLLRRGGGWTAN